MQGGDDLNYKKMFSYAIKLAKPFKLLIVLSMLMTIITMGLYAAIPLVERKIVDEGLLAKDYYLLLRLVIFALILNIIGMIITYIQSKIQVKIDLSCKSKLKFDVFSHSIRLKIGYLNKHGLYKIINDANYDAQIICRLVSNEFLGIIIEFLKIVGYFIGLLYINWKLTIFVVLFIPLKIIITNVSGKIREKKCEESLEIQKNLHRWQGNTFDGIYEVKLWNMYEIKEREYSELLKKNNKVIASIYRIDELDRLFSSVTQKLLFSLLYIIAGALIWKNGLTIGGLFAFIAYAGNVFYPIDLVSRLKLISAEIIPSLRSYEDFLKMDEEDFSLNNSFKFSPEFPKRIEFKDVTIGYEGKEVLKNINLSLDENEKIALVGANGSGKTTLINMLLRFYTPEKGKILMDGIDINEIPLKNYRDLFAVVSQSVYLFKGSIWENITMFETNKPTSEKNFKFIKDKLLHFTKKLENGYDTHVGINGRCVSGGEKQKIALARALLKKHAKILILDEATSNCDVLSEKEIVKMLEENNYDFTICITHNVNLLKNFDKIIFIDKGQVITDRKYYDGVLENS